MIKEKRKNVPTGNLFNRGRWRRICLLERTSCKERFDVIYLCDLTGYKGKVDAGVMQSDLSHGHIEDSLLAAAADWNNEWPLEFPNLWNVDRSMCREDFKQLIIRWQLQEKLLSSKAWWWSHTMHSFISCSTLFPSLDPLMLRITLPSHMRI